MGLLDQIPSWAEFRGNLIAGAIAVGIFGLVAVGSGAGFSVRAATILFMLFVGFSFITRQSGDYTIGFVIISLGLLMVAADYLLPDFIVEPLTVFGDAFRVVTGVNLGAVGSWQFFVLSVVSVFFVIAARVRYGASAGVWIDRVFDRTLREFQKYISNYITFARLFAVFLFGVLIIVFEQGASFFGVVGDVIQQVPFIVSNFVLTLAGYASLGGDLVIVDGLPLLGTLSALDFLVLGAVLIALAAATKYTGSGPLARFIR